jgi:hypothetical protein
MTERRPTGAPLDLFDLLRREHQLDAEAEALLDADVPAVGGPEPFRAFVLRFLADGEPAPLAWLAGPLWEATVARASEDRLRGPHAGPLEAALTPHLPPSVRDANERAVAAVRDGDAAAYAAADAELVAGWSALVRRALEHLGAERTGAGRDECWTLPPPPGGAANTQT